MRIPAAALALVLGLAAAASADPYEKLAKSLTKDLGEHSGKKAAVVPFSYTDGRASEGGAVVAAAIETALVGRGLVLVERAQLDKLLEELNLQRTGLVPEKSALQIGRTAGADFLVTGTLADAGYGRAEANARLIKVETGEVLRAGKAKIRKTWDDAPPINAPGAPGSPPQAAGVRFTLQSASVSGATRRVGDMDLALRYGDQGSRPILRITDYTDPKDPEWVEIPFEYDPRAHRYSPNWSAQFRLAGRSYHIWADEWQQFHLAPLRGLLRRPVSSQETTLPVNSVFEAWIEDIDRRNQTLIEAGEPSGSKWIAYFEPMGGLDLRISIFSARGAEIVYSPVDVAVLEGDKNRTVSSRLMGGGTNLFRFHYSAAAQEVAAEKVQ